MNLNFLRPPHDRRGAWVTVYADATRAGENANREGQLRSQALRSKPLHQGADQASVDAASGAVKNHPYKPGNATCWHPKT